MSDIQRLQQKLTYSKKQTAYAWAKNYEMYNEIHSEHINQYQQNNSVLEYADDLPIHLVKEIEEMIADMHESVNQMRSAKKQLKAYAKLLKNDSKADTLISTGENLINRIDTWEANLIQPKQKTFQDVINYNNQLNAELMYLKDFTDTADPIITEGARERLNDLKKDWSVYQKERDDIITTEMSAYNDLYRTLKIPALIID